MIPLEPSEEMTMTGGVMALTVAVALAVLPYFVG